MNLEINHGGKGKLYIHSCGSTSEYFYLNKVEWDLNYLQTNVCIFFFLNACICLKDILSIEIDHKGGGRP